MRRLVLPALVVMLLSLALASPAKAITFGEFDADNRFPNVATLAADFDGTGPEGYFSFCTGTLIAPKVVLTAAHCLVFLPEFGLDKVAVSFDSTFGSDSKLYMGSYVANPGYGQNNADLKDIGVVLLDEVPEGITPASLPKAGLLDQLQKSGELRDATFYTAGYGTVRYSKTKGPAALAGNTNRNFAAQTVNALNKTWLRFSMNPSTGDGGTCYGDSGGPHFLGDTDIVVSITVTGDIPCRATDVTYRTDSPSARAFLAEFVTLP